MQRKTTICLWYNDQAAEAADFYTRIFKHAEITNSIKQNSKILTVSFNLEGMQLLALNGGPMFTPDPSISLFVTTSDGEELQHLWDNLASGGQVLMPLDKYPWSEKYGWVQDRFGVSWQLYQGDEKQAGQKIAPMLMFCGKQQGRAEEAIGFYTSVFKNAKTDSLEYYTEGQTEHIDAKVVHARFHLEGDLFMAMDSGIAQPFDFNEGVSIIVNCDSQDEIDYYWKGLIHGGGKEVECGWLKDKFGVSWQIVPGNLNLLLAGDPEKSKRVMASIMKMKKLVIADLENA